jgi:hypothetical protein
VADPRTEPAFGPPATVPTYRWKRGFLAFLASEAKIGEFGAERGGSVGGPDGRSLPFGRKQTVGAIPLPKSNDKRTRRPARQSDVVIQKQGR